MRALLLLRSDCIAFWVLKLWFFCFSSRSRCRFVYTLFLYFITILIGYKREYFVCKKRGKSLTKKKTENVKYQQRKADNTNIPPHLIMIKQIFSHFSPIRSLFALFLCFGVCFCRSNSVVLCLCVQHNIIYVIFPVTKTPSTKNEAATKKKYYERWVWLQRECAILMLFFSFVRHQQ